MALVDDFATLTTLTQARDAFTTGTAANQAVMAQASSVAVQLEAGMAQANAWFGANPVAAPDTLTTAVQNAGYLAQGLASRAWVSRLMAILDRP